MAGSDSSQHL